MPNKTGSWLSISLSSIGGSVGRRSHTKYQVSIGNSFEGIDSNRPICFVGDGILCRAGERATFFWSNALVLFQTPSISLYQGSAKTTVREDTRNNFIRSVEFQDTLLARVVQELMTLMSQEVDAGHFLNAEQHDW